MASRAPCGVSAANTSLLSQFENPSLRVVLDNLKPKHLSTSATCAQRTSQLFEGNVGPDLSRVWGRTG